MSERKVLNKYYPPDFDPSKIPRMKLPRNRQYTVRLMAPFNMRCVTCGEYIYKGKKFNARKEDVEGQDYLGIRIYRFYIKCTRCLQEISFKTDPQNTDYEIEAGATRNFMALKLAEEQAQKEEDERKEDESTNPMKLLENRTKQSKQELELLESLEELRDLNRRQQTVDYDTMLSKYDGEEARKTLLRRQEEEDEKFIKSVFRPDLSNKRVIEEEIVKVDEEGDDFVEASRPTEPARKTMRTVAATSTKDGEDAVKPTDTMATHPLPTSSTKPCPVWSKSIGVMSKKGALAGLVRIRKPVTSETENGAPESSAVSSGDVSKTTAKPSGLSLLGSYSSSGSDEDSK